ncbi:MAG: hypothetical protein ACRDHC_06885, partial [Actinomycetota bacterium]
TVTAHASISSPPAPDPEEMPLCPSCRRGLEGNLCSRMLSLEATSRVLFVAYCTNCGVAIETRIEEAGP